MGTFSKVAPTVGGFVAGSATDHHIRRRASGIFSAALPLRRSPGSKALDIVEREPERRKQSGNAVI